MHAIQRDEHCAHLVIFHTLCHNPCTTAEPKHETEYNVRMDVKGPVSRTRIGYVSKAVLNFGYLYVSDTFGLISIWIRPNFPQAQLPRVTKDGNGLPYPTGI